MFGMSDQMMAQLAAATQDHDQLMGQNRRRCQPGEQIRERLTKPIKAGERQVWIGTLGKQIKQWLILVGPALDDAFGRHRVDETSPRKRALHRLDPDHGSMLFASARAAPLEAGAVFALRETTVFDCSLRSRGAFRTLVPSRDA
jgi:hypothetical protein